MPKKTKGKKATRPNERLFQDLATVKAPKSLNVTVTRPHWQLLVDERTNMKFSSHHETKDGMVEPTCVKMSKLADIAGDITYLRQDNAGENLKLAKRMGCADWKMKTKIEYTARGTPQQNHMAELGFTAIAARSRAAMNRANFPLEVRYTTFCEVSNCIAKLDWLTVIELDGEKKTRIEHYQGSLPAFANQLRTIGEAGTVRIGKNGKVKDRGVTMLFIGYATQHEGDCWRMYNPETKRVSQTRDVIWLNRMFYEKPNAKTTMEDPVIVLEVVKPQEVDEFSDDDSVEIIPALKRGGVDADSDDEESVESKDSDDESVASKESDDASESGKKVTWMVDKPTTRSGRVIQQAPAWIRAIETGMANTAISAATTNYFASLAEIEEDEVLGFAMVENEYVEYANVGAGVGGGFENTAELKPMKYDQAINGPEAEAWKAEIENEHDRMVKNKVFQEVQRKDLPHGAKPIDSTWACKKKSNGTHRAKVNGSGFKQIPGQHYDSSSIHAPVTNATSIRVILVLMLMANWTANVVDVKGAFLHGEFTDGEEIFMEVPQGFEKHYPGNVVLRLLKTIYGLKQAAMAFWRMLLRCMQDMGMQRSTADPCLYYDWTDLGLVIILSWIDDNLIVGSKQAVSVTKQELMSRFDCEDCGELDEYVGCRLTRNKERLSPPKVFWCRALRTNLMSQRRCMPHRRNQETF